MGFNFRKSIKMGPARINLSKSGVGYSIGAGGLRYTKSPKKKKKKEKITFSSAIGYLFGLLIIFFFLAAIASLIIDFIVRFKWFFIAVGIISLSGVIAYFIIKFRESIQPDAAMNESNTVSESDTK